MKKADLATPRGIDHDYNYLTSIERELDRAERDANARGVVLEAEISGKHRDKRRGEVHLQNAIEKCGVVIARAPKGMTRSNQNETSWAKKYDLSCIYFDKELGILTRY